jgi:alpha-tubulin suppressor-like RCC1 family protein
MPPLAKVLSTLDRLYLLHSDYQMKKHFSKFSWQVLSATIGFIIFYYLPINAHSTVLATGRDHTCGIKNHNHLTCWGNNKWDQATLPNETTFIQVSAGQNYTCGIQTDNTVICWASG